MKDSLPTFYEKDMRINEKVSLLKLGKKDFETQIKK